MKSIALSEPARLHLGSGGVVISGWRNLDGDAHEGVEKCDLTRGIPAEDGSIDEIFTSHFLEHLRVRHEAAPFLRECYRVLRAGGVMTHVTPNFEALIRAYSRSGTLRLASGTFGDGRTPWDYHVSAWWPGRWSDLARTGRIVTVPGEWEVFPGPVELVLAANVWRPHSGFEVIGSLRKPGSNLAFPTALLCNEIAPQGWYQPLAWALRSLPHPDARAYFPWLVRSALSMPLVRNVIQRAARTFFRPVDVQALVGRQS